VQTAAVNKAYTFRNVRQRLFPPERNMREIMMMIMMLYGPKKARI